MEQEQHKWKFWKTWPPSKRAWALIALGYLIGAIGLGVALWLVSDQNDELEEQVQRLEIQQEQIAENAIDVAESSGVLCHIVLLPEEEEETVMVDFLSGRLPDDFQFNPLCEEFVRRLLLGRLTENAP